MLQISYFTEGMYVSEENRREELRIMRQRRTEEL